MSERCGCGAAVPAGLHFCVACGRARPAPAPSVGAASRPTGRHAAALAPTVTPTPTPAPVAPPIAPTPGPAFGPAVPPAPARSAAPWIVAAAGVVVVAIAAAVTIVLMRPAVVRETAAPAPVVVTTLPSAATSSSSDSAGGTGDGTDALRSTVGADRSSVESLSGQWVAQLSSKRPGTVDNGIVYDPATIYAHYRALASAHPGALLLWSGDWSVYRETDYWVVVEGQGFSSAAGANAWCSAQGLGPGDCFAKRLSHTAGPAGTSVAR